VKLAFAINDKKLAGKLTKFWTGCYAYHVFWHDDEHMWDMHLIRRRRLWPHYGPETTVVAFDVPAVTREFLEHQLSTDAATYGWRDYLLFGLRPLYHLLGRSTRNVGGVICSEMVNNDLLACGVATPWAQDAPPPSPCDLLRWKHAA